MKLPVLTTLCVLFAIYSTVSTLTPEEIANNKKINDKFYTETLPSQYTPFVSKYGNFCYRSKTNTTKVLCSPRFWLPGSGKAGSSALYQYFIDHPDYCQAVPKEYTNPIGETFMTMYGKCVDKYAGNFGFFNEYHFARFPETKTAYIARHFPEYIYARFNFWCIKGFDKNCEDWVTPEHYRSPASFHTVIVGSGSYTFFYPWKINVKEQAQHYEGMFKNFIAIQSEQLYENTQEQMDKLYKFMGMAPHKLTERVLGKAFNTHDNKGIFKSKDKNAEEFKNKYKNEIFPETYNYISKAYYDECMWFTQKHGFDWDCTYTNDTTIFKNPTKVSVVEVECPDCTANTQILLLLPVVMVASWLGVRYWNGRKTDRHLV